MSETPRLPSTRKHVQSSFQHAHSALWNANHGRRKQRSIIKEMDRGQQGSESPQKSSESYSHANQSSFGVEERLEVRPPLARLLKNNH
jgi:hypothetical protein